MNIAVIDRIKLRGMIKEQKYDEFLKYTKERNYEPNQILSFLNSEVEQELSSEPISLKRVKKLLYILTRCVEGHFISQEAKEMLERRQQVKKAEIKEKNLDPFLETELLECLESFNEQLGNINKPVVKEADDMQNKVASQEAELKEKEQKIKNLEKKLWELRQKQFQLYSQYELNERKNESILKQRDDFQKELIALKKEQGKWQEDTAKYQELLQERQAEEEKERQSLKRTEQLKELIIKYLSASSLSLNSLKNKLNQDGISISAEELYHYLWQWNQTLNIRPYRFTDEVLYKMQRPLVETNKIYPMHQNKAVLNWLVCSDFHCNPKAINPNRYQYRPIETYVEQNNIDAIVNLGDFCGFSSHMLSQYNTYDLLNDVTKTIKEFATIFNPGIPVYYIGGNHDDYFLSKGIDIMKYLESLKPDFVNLGYNNAYITFDETNYIQLYHPNNRYENYSEEIIKCLERVKESTQRKNVIFSFLGHLHISYLDVVNHYCIVPSFNKDRNMNGAWHVTLYFNQTELTDIIFKPLVVDAELKPVTEIHHSLTLNKKVDE